IYTIQKNRMMKELINIGIKNQGLMTLHMLCCINSTAYTPQRAIAMKHWFSRVIRKGSNQSNHSQSPSMVV
ncbi:MAG: hypothetical protein JSW04_08545, partial [Desulfobacterales bacterium]